MTNEDIEVKIERMETNLKRLTEQKQKYVSKIAGINQKIEETQAKLKDIKSGALVEVCEKRELSVKDIQRLSTGIADGTVLDFLGIKTDAEEEKENEKENEKKD